MNWKEAWEKFKALSRPEQAVTNMVALNLKLAGSEKPPTETEVEWLKVRVSNNRGINVKV